MYVLKMKLRFLNGRMRGETLEIERLSTYTIGREPTCEICLDEPLVSKKHAAVSYTDEAFRIEDLGSRNGTYVDSKRIEGKAVLKEGSIISIGMHVLCVEEGLLANDATLIDKTIMDVHASLPGKQWVGPHKELKECIEGLEAIVDEHSDMMVKASLKMIFNVLPVDRLSIFPVRGDGEISQGYTVTRESGVSNDHMSRSFAAKILELGVPHLFEDAQALSPEEWGMTIQQERIRSIIGVPIELRGRVVAVLLADSLASASLDDTHMRIMKFVAKAIEVVYQRDAVYKLDNLGKFLPICSVCKKIRDDKGYWNQIEGFISQRTDVAFSHGYCPSCAEQAMAEYEAQAAKQ